MFRFTFTIALLVNVIITHAQEEKTSSVMQFAGILAAGKTVHIQSRIDGVVMDVTFVEGGLVQKGAVLFQLDPTLYKFQVELAKERLVAIKHEIERTNLMRLERKRENEDAIHDKLNAASARLRELKTEHRIAEIELAVLEVELSFTRILAPISGRIGHTEFTQGSVVSATKPSTMATLVSSDSMYVYFDIGQEPFLRLGPRFDKPGESRQPRVHIKVDGEESIEHEGMLDFIDTHFNAKTRTIRCRAVIRNHDPRLVPGMKVTVRIAPPKE